MTLTGWAAGYAEELLAPLGDGDHDQDDEEPEPVASSTSLVRSMQPSRHNSSTYG